MWDCNFELLMSLRSIEKNLEEKEIPVFVLSEQPVQYVSDKVKFVRVTSYMDALAKASNLAEEILWMNDDIMLLQPHKWEDFRRWCVQRYNVPDRTVQGLIKSDNGWRQRKGKVLLRLKSMDKTQHDYSTHTPYLYETDKLAEVLQKFNFGYKTAVETAYGNYWGVPHRKATRLERHHEGPLPIDTSSYELFNYDDKGANPHCRGFLLGHFPACSKYEDLGDVDTSKLLYTRIK